MARGYSAEYAQWLHENSFSQADEKLMLKTVTGRMFIWFLLTCIPGFGFFILPLFMNAWSWRKFIRQKTFEPRPGLLYGFCALAMYITFIAIIPWIIWGLAKRNQWGTGLRRLIKKGKIGNCAFTVDDEAAVVPHQQQKRGFPWWILVILLVILVGAAAVLGLLDRKTPMEAATTVLQNYAGTHVDTVTGALENLGIRYQITYVTDSSKAPGTVVRHEPGWGTIVENITSVELFVVRDCAIVPDFSAATSVEEVRDMAQQNDLQVNFIYTDEPMGLFFDAIPEGMMIDRIYCSHAPGMEVDPGITVTVTICLKADGTLLGAWHRAEMNYGSLYLTSYQFNEDGTFSYYHMGYMAVDYETPLYTYGTYWDGAMGADMYDGTYTLTGSQLILSYNYWDWDLEAEVPAIDVYQISFVDGVLHLLQEGTGHTFQYHPGSQPDRDAVLPFSMCGSWYALGTPNDSEFGNRFMTVYTLQFFENGTFEASHDVYANDGSGWYFPGGGCDLMGEYSFDGTNLVLHYTTEMQPVFDDHGEYMGTENVPMDETETFVLTVESGEITAIAQNSAGLCCFVRYHTSPYVNVDITGAPLEHAGQLFP